MCVRAEEEQRVLITINLAIIDSRADTRKVGNVLMFQMH